MEPLIWLGAYSPGKLALPAAQPTPSQVYAPRGVFLGDDLLVVADSGNHRVLIWHSIPVKDGQPADVVLGQPDFYSEGPNAAGQGTGNGLHLPTGVGVYENRLFVADAWNHRILVWNTIPETSNQPPDWVLGQHSLAESEVNRGQSVTDSTLYWPYSLAYFGGWFYVTDTGNRRVLGWRGLPETDRPADLVLGQPDLSSNLENRGKAIGPDSFRWPHDLAGDDAVMFVADAGNHRVLGWSPHPEGDAPAQVCFGQPTFEQAQELPYVAQGPQKLRFPYSIAFENGRLAVADTANNRVLFWNDAPTSGIFHPADAVIGQVDFKGNGENHWKQVDRDTLCWPYGIHLRENLLAIADSGNNRVMLWKV